MQRALQQLQAQTVRILVDDSKLAPTNHDKWIEMDRQSIHGQDIASFDLSSTRRPLVSCSMNQLTLTRPTTNGFGC